MEGTFACACLAEVGSHYRSENQGEDCVLPGVFVPRYCRKHGGARLLCTTSQPGVGWSLENATSMQGTGESHRLVMCVGWRPQKMSPWKLHKWPDLEKGLCDELSGGSEMRSSWA